MKKHIKIDEQIEKLISDGLICKDDNLENIKGIVTY